jgi:hypothetical protein
MLHTERHELENAADVIWSYAWDQNSDRTVTAARWCIPTVQEIVSVFEATRKHLVEFDSERLDEELTDLEDCLSSLRDWLEQLPFPDDPNKGRRLYDEMVVTLDNIYIPEPDEMATELRFRCTETEWWSNTGCSDYDQDHRGVCAFGYVVAGQDDNEMSEACDILNEIWEQVFQQGGSTHNLGRAETLDDAKAMIAAHLAQQEQEASDEEA